MPTIAELRTATQPASIFARNSGEHWAGRLYVRRASPYLTRWLIATRLTPDAVTWLMIAVGLAAAAVLTLPGWWPPVVVVLLIQGQLLLDCSDGELAGAASLFTAFLREEDGLSAGLDACLRRHGLPRLPSDLGLGDEQFARAVVHAPLTRPDRYTILEHLALDDAGARGRVRAYAEAFA